MAPPPRLARRTPRHGTEGVKELFERDDEIDWDSDDEDENYTPASGSGSSAAPTLSASPRPAQAGAGDVDPNGSLSRVSEDGMHIGARTGIAFGVIGGVILLLSVVYFLWRRQNRQKKATLTVTPATRIVPPSQLPADARTDSQILSELRATALAHQNGGTDMAVTDEKRHSDSSYPGDTGEGLSYPYHQAKIRPSIASWLRRHHPLQLNSLSRWSTTTTSSVPKTPLTNRGTIPPLPPVPAMPGMARQSSRFKSVWSDSTDESDADPSRRASVVTFETLRVAQSTNDNRSQAGRGVRNASP